MCQGHSFLIHDAVTHDVMAATAGAFSERDDALKKGCTGREVRLPTRCYIISLVRDNCISWHSIPETIVAATATQLRNSVSKVLQTGTRDQGSSPSEQECLEVSTIGKALLC